MTKKSISKLPKAGLGNKLFSWASGLVFSKINNRDHIVLGLTKIHPRVILRGEKSRRFYIGYFKNERLFYCSIKKRNVSLLQKEADLKYNENRNVIFSQIPHWSDMFHTLRDYRDVIVKGFWSGLTDKINKKVEAYPEPFIGVHIRMGDFRTLKENEDFSKVGAVRTPLNYFIEVINILRRELDFNAGVTLFSDGNATELGEILLLPNIKVAEDDLDIVHLSLLSKSKIIVMSAGSTFSYWAGFLSEAILINHYQHIHAPIRDDETNKAHFEGSINLNEGVIDVSLKKALKLLKEMN